MISARVIGDESGLDDIAASWDDLAVRLGQPYCTPTWMLQWWRHAARHTDRLRVVAVHDGDALLGVAPFVVRSDVGGLTRYKIVASPACDSAQPIADPAHVQEVVRAAAAAIATASPQPDTIEFDAIEASCVWPEALRAHWPARVPPVVVAQHTLPAPAVTLDDGSRSYEEWLQRQSRNFRQQARRRRRQLEAQGARFRMTSSADDLARDLEAFAALHRARWEDRGGSAMLSDGVEQMLHAVGAAWVGTGRLRLWLLETDEQVISAQLFVGAGGRLSYWLGGFDEGWARYQPSLQTILTALDDAFDHGYRELALGGGDQTYKHRLGDTDPTIRGAVLLIAGRRLPLAVARLGPKLLRARLSGALSPTTKDRLLRLLGRPTAGHDRLEAGRA